MYLNNPNHVQIQDISCSQAGEAVMDFIEEKLIQPLIVNDLMTDEQIEQLAPLGGAIKILATKAQAYENLFDNGEQLPYSCN